MNTTIQKKMKTWKAENLRKPDMKVWMSADEWGEQLDMTITPQRMTAMYKAGLVERCQDKAYYGDNKYRYNVI